MPSKLATPPQELQQFVPFVSDALADARGGNFTAQASIAQHVPLHTEQGGRFGFAVCELLPYPLLLARLPLQNRGHDLLYQGAQDGVIKDEIHEATKEKTTGGGIPVVLLARQEL